MATKDTAGAIWEKLELSLDAIYQKYQAQKKALQQTYQSEIASLSPTYAALKTEAAAQNRIAKSNFARKAAESGLGSSGEALRRSLLQDAALQQNLTTLSLAQEGKKSELEAEARTAEQNLSAKENEEIADYTYQLSKLYFDEVDRESKREMAQKEWEQKEAQNAAENELKQQELNLKKEQQAFEQRIKEALTAAQIESYKASAARDNAAAEKDRKETEKTSSGTVFVPQENSNILGVGGTNLTGGNDGTNFVPESLSAKALVDSITKEYEIVDRNGNVSHDKKAIANRVRTIVANVSLSADYRYEVYLYAVSLGYL